MKFLDVIFFSTPTLTCATLNPPSPRGLWKSWPGYIFLLRQEFNVSAVLFNKLVYLQVWEVVWCNCSTKCLCWLAVCRSPRPGGMSEHNIFFGLKTKDCFLLVPDGWTESDSPSDSKSFASASNTIDFTNVLFITLFRPDSANWYTLNTQVATGNLYRIQHGCSIFIIYPKNEKN